MARCPKCKLLVGRIAEVCPRCGSRLPRQIRAVLWGGVVGLAILIVAFAALRGGWIDFIQSQIVLARLPAPNHALINRFLATITPPERLVEAAIPTVGCPRSGQSGPENAPALPKTISVVVPAGSEPFVAYYSAHERIASGVLAPRDWKCVEVYGSSGESLYVTPSSLERPENLKGGAAVIMSVRYGDTSGRFTVAEISARAFPQARRFTEQVMKEQSARPDVFALGPSEQIKHLSDFVVSYATPPGNHGIGTSLGLLPGAQPIFGLTFLLGAFGFSNTSTCSYPVAGDRQTNLSCNRYCQISFRRFQHCQPSQR
jgi:hypothetical protein